MHTGPGRPRGADMCCLRARSYATQNGVSGSGKEPPVGDATAQHNLKPHDRSPMRALDGSTHDSVSNVDPQGPPQPERPRPAPELSIVVPTFNERENVPHLVDTLKAALPDVAWELIVVDDNSPDGTAETAKRIAATDSRIRCMRRVGADWGARASRESWRARRNTSP